MKSMRTNAAAAMLALVVAFSAPASPMIGEPAPCDALRIYEEYKAFFPSIANGEYLASPYTVPDPYRALRESGRAAFEDLGPGDCRDAVAAQIAADLCGFAKAHSETSRLGPIAWDSLEEWRQSVRMVSYFAKDCMVPDGVIDDAYRRALADCEFDLESWQMVVQETTVPGAKRIMLAEPAHIKDVDDPLVLAGALSSAGPGTPECVRALELCEPDLPYLPLKEPVTIRQGAAMRIAATCDPNHRDRIVPALWNELEKPERATEDYVTLIAHTLRGAGAIDGRGFRQLSAYSRAIRRAEFAESLEEGKLQAPSFYTYSDFLKHGNQVKE